MTDKKGLLDKKEPSAVRLSKTVIIVIALVLGMSLLYIFVSSFNRASKKPQSTAKISIGQVSNNNDQESLAQLPSSYEDSKKIDTLLNRNQPNNNQLPDNVKLMIKNLRDEQQSLKDELAQVRSDAENKTKQDDNNDQQAVYDAQASSSAIFFPGGAPPPVKTSFSMNDDSQKKSDRSQKDDNSNSGQQQNGYQYDPYGQQNMQTQKFSFMSGKVDTNIYNKNALQYPVSKYELQVGSVIPAILQTKIVSNNPGIILARVSNDIYDSINGKYLLIPKDSRLVGEYNSKIAYGQYQIQAKFVRLIRPDGSSIVLTNEPGTDSMGVSGLEDEINNHWGKIIGSAALSALFNLPAVIATNQMNNNNNKIQCIGEGDQRQCYPVSNIGQTATSSLLQSAGQAASEVGSQLTSRSLNIQPTITINAGYEFSVLVSKDTVLPPYRSPVDPMRDN